MQVIEGPIVEWKGSAGPTENTRLAQAETEPMAMSEVPADENQEKIIGGWNNLRPIAFLEAGIIRSRPVALVNLPGRGRATGFLIGPDLLMTNHHVFRAAGDATDAIVKFNYQADLAGNELQTDDYHLLPQEFFWTSPEAELDCSIVRVQGRPGDRWGFIPLPSADSLRVTESVFIIQHPGGQPKAIGVADNEVEYLDDRVVQYLTDTMPGSSGSPVFDQSWQLVALHHSGGWIPEPASGSTHYRNEGIRVSALAAALKDVPGASATP